MHSVIWAPPGTRGAQTETAREFYDGVVGALAAAAEEAVRSGELAPGAMRSRMLILMGRSVRRRPASSSPESRS